METKPWYQSKTIWASLVALAAVIAQALGLSIGEEDQAALVDAILNAVAIAGTFIAVYGRTKATKSIK